METNRVTVSLEGYAFRALGRIRAYTNDTLSDIVRAALLAYFSRPVDSYYRQRITGPETPTPGGGRLLSMEEFEQKVQCPPIRREFPHRVSFAVSPQLRAQLDQRARQEQTGKSTIIRRAIDFMLLDQVIAGENGKDRQRAATSPVVHEPTVT